MELPLRLSLSVPQEVQSILWMVAKSVRNTFKPWDTVMLLGIYRGIIKVSFVVAKWISSVLSKMPLTRSPSAEAHFCEAADPFLKDTSRIVSLSGTTVCEATKWICRFFEGTLFGWFKGEPKGQLPFCGVPYKTTHPIELLYSSFTLIHHMTKPQG